LLLVPPCFLDLPEVVLCLRGAFGSRSLVPVVEVYDFLAGICLFVARFVCWCWSMGEQKKSLMVAKIKEQDQKNKF
jgi:hypothetical protein